MRNWFYLLIGVFFIFIIHACEDTPCNQTMESLVGGQFFSLDTNNAKTDTIIPYLAVFSPEQPDTMFADSSLNSVKLSLSPEKDETELVFAFSSARDTLIFRYTREFILVSQDCGFQTVYNIDTVISTKKSIDSLSLVNPIVNIDEKQHLEIFMF